MIGIEFNPVRCGFAGGEDVWLTDVLNVGVKPEVRARVRVRVRLRVRLRVRVRVWVVLNVGVKPEVLVASPSP